jgi:HEPN domain-containing protein
MKTEPIPKLEPLVNDLKNLNMGDFLKSNVYKRYCIKAGFEESWRNALNRAKQNRGYFAAGFDHDYYDSLDALVLWLNHLHKTSQNNFFYFINDLLRTYTEWNKEDLRVNEIIEDIELLDAPFEILENIFKLGCYYSNPVPKSRIPDSIWNAEKLDSVLNKMDLSIKNGEYNLTITYAYSCLEGLYKAFLIERIPEKMHIDKLNQLSKAVRDYLIDYFVKENISYPEQIINLIPTITNAISQARNSFSDSHFDGESEKWLAEFTRDCVNSIGRLIIKFIKE